jgi:hypothetical protein
MTSTKAHASIKANKYVNKINEGKIDEEINSRAERNSIHSLPITLSFLIHHTPPLNCLTTAFSLAACAIASRANCSARREVRIAGKEARGAASSPQGSS